MGKILDKKSEKVPARVYLLGLVSLFNDIASEMLYPIIPIFLTQVLGTPVFVVGIIDGVAEGASSLFKTIFGYLSDRLQKRKRFVVLGYAASAISKVIIAFSKTWPSVFLGRFIDRLGKGVRTGARDAMLLEVSGPRNKGLIFGVHRTFDSIGAVIGPLIALFLLQFFNNNLRSILYIAAIPSFIGLLFFFFIKETRKKIDIGKTRPSFLFSLKNISPSFRYFLIVIALFSLGNSTDSFLILKSRQIDLSISVIILVYVLYNLVYTLLSTPAGIISDKLGAKKVFLLGLLIYIAVYIGFAFNKNPSIVWLLFGTYGAYIALTDGISKALVGSFISKEEGGMAFGVLQTVTSVFTLLASVIGGFLWSFFSPSVTFLFGASCASLAFLLFFMEPFLRRKTVAI